MKGGKCTFPLGWPATFLCKDENYIIMGLREHPLIFAKNNINNGVDLALGSSQ